MKNVKVFQLLLVLTALIEIVAEYFAFKILIIILKPLFFIVLYLLYRINSPEKNLWFLWTMVSIAIATLFFSLGSFEWILLGSSVYVFHRCLLLIYIYKMMKIKDIIPIIIASLPFLILFFYIFIEAKMLNDGFFYIVIVNNFLISFLGGIALSNYIMKENNRSSWLMISVLLFVSHNFISFIEKMYIALPILRFLALILNAIAYYTFYKFTISIENNNVKPKEISVF